RPLVAGDLDEADRIFRVAFGTFLGVPEPERFFGDVDMVRTRWRADPGAALAAELGGRLAGSNFAANWGSVGFFGPLTVAPEYWDRAIAQRLLDATMDLFEAWGTRHAGLFTFAQSAKHVGLYQKYGFWPRFLTAVMTSPVQPDSGRGPVRLSALDEVGRAGAVAAVRELTDAVYPGLDVSREIESVLAQGLGDIVLIDDASGVQGVAICHAGADTEAGSGACYVKFGAVRPGPGAERLFGLLIDACHALAAEVGASVLVAGANAGRERAWRALAGRGFRREFQGVAMHRPNEPGYSTSDSFVIDDWR
ncbi:MAG: GNAT family N-acetyltransferase, partial [Streptosporangiaceae bacterium]